MRRGMPPRTLTWRIPHSCRLIGRADPYQNLVGLAVRLEGAMPGVPALCEFGKEEGRLAAKQRRQDLALLHGFSRSQDTHHRLRRIEVAVVEMPDGLRPARRICRTRGRWLRFGGGGGRGC